MKFVAILSALFALSTANAFAVNVNGTWKGAGKITDNQGHNIPCESITLMIVHTPTVLNVSSDFTCAGQRTNAPGGNLELRNGDVYDQGVKIGRMTDTGITLSMKNAQQSMETTTTFSDKEMAFKTVTTSAAQPGVVVTFEGVVRR